MVLIWQSLVLVVLINRANGFIPANAVEYIINTVYWHSWALLGFFFVAKCARLHKNKKVDKEFDLGKVSRTLVHEDIIKRGIIRSVAKYLQDQKTPGAMRIRNRHHNHMETHYYQDPRHLYHDFYNKWICELDLEILIATEFQPMVAVVDFEANTKDLPYAHFDAETFIESNKRVYVHLFSSWLPNVIKQIVQCHTDRANLLICNLKTNLNCLFYIKR